MNSKKKIPSSRGRWSSKRKADVVLRLLRGEELDALSRELGVKTATLAGWRDDFLAGGEASLLARKTSSEEGAIKRLQAKVGEITMANELLEEKIRILEEGHGSPRSRRSRR